MRDQVEERLRAVEKLLAVFVEELARSRGQKATREIFMRMRDGGHVHRGPEIAVMRDGKNARLRTRQPLQAGRGDAELEVAVEATLRDPAVALEPEQALRFEDNVI